ncbi:MAG: alpha/beta hydrolase [Leadbetterella sp.]|nr:alpha/beta hydrolase [Leadbetterella sp.]
MTFKNEKEGNLLAGTLASPGEKKDIPMLVMITGSGPQNRDSDIMGHKFFLVIADHLAKQGIGTLRLDDRGIGGSERGKEEPTSEDFAGDINSAVNFLVAKGYTNIGLTGHSEGGLIAPIVGASNRNVKFIVMLAGPGIPLDRNMDLQFYNLLKNSGLGEDVLDDVSQGLRSLMRDIKERETPHTKQELKSELSTVFSKAPEDLRNAFINDIGPLFSSSWGRYFLKFNPEEYLSKIKVPLLALNGGLDMNVPAKENLEGIKKALEKGGNKRFEVVEIEGLNHLFQTAKTGSPAEYSEIEETISPKVLEKISTWVLGLK